MRDGEWRLIYPGTDLVFGTGATEVFNLTTPDLGDVAMEVADRNRPRTDGVAFGVDFRGGRTITFDLGVHTDSEIGVRAALSSLAAAWRADVVRSTPGATAELRMQYRGQERVVFGRPRRFAPVIREAKTGLFASATADFMCADDRFYSTAEHTASVNLVPEPSGGLESPLASPLSTTRTSDRSTVITVSSELPVWPVIEIDGPITNPEVEIVGQWKVALRTTLAYDHTVVIDTAPWARTILRNGASIAGSVTRQSVRLRNASLPSGSYEFVLRGTDATGTAQARVRWRDSYPTP